MLYALLLLLLGIGLDETDIILLVLDDGGVGDGIVDVIGTDHDIHNRVGLDGDELAIVDNGLILETLEILLGDGGPRVVLLDLDGSHRDGDGNGLDDGLLNNKRSDIGLDLNNDGGGLGGEDGLVAHTLAEGILGLTGMDETARTLLIAPRTERALDRRIRLVGMGEIANLAEALALEEERADLGALEIRLGLGNKLGDKGRDRGKVGNERLDNSLLATVDGA